MSKTRPQLLVVNQHVARNPVARSVAQANLQSAVRDFALRLYFLEEGEDCAADCHAATLVLSVAIKALELVKDNGPDRQVMRGALSALMSLAPHFKWKSQHATAVDAGLSRAKDVYKRVPATIMQRAYTRVMQSN